MSPITAFIESGLLELYVMGATTPEETIEIEAKAAEHPEIRKEIESIQQGLENYAINHAIAPRDTVKTLLMATIDYLERMKKGEPISSPPELTAKSTAEDYAEWLSREDLQYINSAENIYARIIGYNPSSTTAIVWLKDSASEEIHHDEQERFLILEGTCTIMVEDVPNYLKPGDFFSIPLHMKHQVKVTSAVPCKVILQRLSA